ncbi:MAG TPA: TolC family protein, partial [Waddliaceae bacterium]
QLLNRYSLEENSLAALLGKPASSWKIPPGNLPKNIPALPPVLPSEILIRRADIQSALSKVSAGRSEVNVALRNYFPSFPLSSTLGLSTPLISHFFEWQARYWGYALNAIQPLFDGGKRASDVNYAKARFWESFSFYQKTVNQAFKDVEDALSSLHLLGLQLEAQTRAAVAASDTYCLSEEQFKSGLISYLLVADSKNTSISVERQTIALKGEQLMAYVRVMKAFGLQN